MFLVSTPQIRKGRRSPSLHSVGFECTVALSPHAEALKFDVTVQQIRLGILFVLLQGPVIWEQLLDTIRRWVVRARLMSSNPGLPH